MDYVLKRASKGFWPRLKLPEKTNVFLPPARGYRRRIDPVYTALVVGIPVAVLVLLAACGVKAPPMPRELVVPAPVTDLTVTTLPEGLRITFTLPSKNLDGSPLEAIGGYRIVREGPEGKDVREDARFSVSETRQWVGRDVVFLDKPPSQAGSYRYCVVPFDIYGSYAGRRRAAEFCWEGTLPE